MLSEEEIRDVVNLKKEMHQEKSSPKISDIRTKKNPGQPINRQIDRLLMMITNLNLLMVYNKYKKIVLMFHKNAQTCHAYCTYCFRFNQFVGKDKFLEEDHIRLHRYLKSHKEVSDLLMTGGDPATMKSDVWKKVLLPLLSPEYDHIQTIRMGTKALTYHPYRFLTDPDADELISLFRKMRDNGKHISIMGHFSHFQEMGPVTLEAINGNPMDIATIILKGNPSYKEVER